MLKNFDPAQANPIRNITCVGDDLALELPFPGDFDPNQVSTQKVCAKPQYNGGARGQHAGAYCYQPPFAPYAGDIAFDTSPGAEASSELQNPRVLLSCRYRCFCNWGLTDQSHQPNAALLINQLEMQPRASEYTYKLQLDIDDDFITPRAQKMGKQGAVQVDSLGLVTRTQLVVEGQQLRPYVPYMPHEYISLDPGNKIRCRGNMPTFRLPPPYTRQDFIDPDVDSIQYLCAMQLSGGNK